MCSHYDFPFSLNKLKNFVKGEGMWLLDVLLCPTQHMRNTKWQELSPESSCTDYRFSHLVIADFTHRRHWKNQGQMFLENGTSEPHRHLLQIPEPHAWVEISAGRLMGSFQGKNWGRGRMWSWWFISGPPSPPIWVSMRPHGPTWWLLSCHTRPILAFIKAVGDFGSPIYIWVLLFFLSKLVKQEIVEAFWWTWYGGVKCCGVFLDLLASPGSSNGKVISHICTQPNLVDENPGAGAKPTGFKSLLAGMNCVPLMGSVQWKLRVILIGATVTEVPESSGRAAVVLLMAVSGFLAGRLDHIVPGWALTFCDLIWDTVLDCRGLNSPCWQFWELHNDL